MSEVETHVIFGGSAGELERDLATDFNIESALHIDTRRVIIAFVSDSLVVLTQLNVNGMFLRTTTVR